jgi:predicted RNA binding protein YcfA (HicA-like mRNA interferase family)
MSSITPKKLLKFLKKRGFYIHHQVGSHITLKLISELKQAKIKKNELFK